MSHYIDPAAFTRLFRQRHRNRATICQGLHAIAANLAPGLTWVDLDDRDDAVQEATIVAMRAIPKFNRATGKSAFSYFTKVIVRELARQRRRLARPRQRMVCFSVLDADGTCLCFEPKYAGRP